MTGSLCHSLCVTHEIQFEKCLGHGVKLHVLKANWNGKPIVLKTCKARHKRTARMIDTKLSKSLTDEIKMTKDDFLKLVILCSLF